MVVSPRVDSGYPVEDAVLEGGYLVGHLLGWGNVRVALKVLAETLNLVGPHELHPGVLANRDHVGFALPGSNVGGRPSRRAFDW